MLQNSIIRNQNVNIAKYIKGSNHPSNEYQGELEGDLH